MANTISKSNVIIAKNKKQTLKCSLARERVRFSSGY